MTFRLARLLVRIFIRVVARVRLVGGENIPVSGGFVVATNHVGRIDAGLPYVVLDRPDVIVLVAEKYREVALTRMIANALRGIWVDRFGADMTAVRASLRRLRAGGVLVIAPEGTRSATGSLLQARSGAGFLAAKSGMPVLPVAVTGSDDAAVSSGLKRLRRARVTVQCGPTFHLTPRPDLAGEARLKAYDDEIMCRIAVLLPPERRGAYADHPRVAELLASS
ncbi:MAG: lysophospholipid acyltransferase family protein [Chloroflexota bacterium]